MYQILFFVYAFAWLIFVLSVCVLSTMDLYLDDNKNIEEKLCWIHINVFIILSSFYL